MTNGKTATMMICDTSVWIALLHNQHIWQVDVLSDRIQRNVPVFMCPIIVQEVLQGVRQDSRYEKVKQSLIDFSIIEDDWLKMSINAAKLYRTLRKKGVTICKPNDCLIASYAIAFNLPVLHQDKDFDQIARYSALKIYPPHA